MKNLLLMRHSYAVGDNPAFADNERPLTDRGRELAVITARMLSEQPIDRVICSSAVRTVETAEIVASVCGISHTHVSDALYLAAPHAYRDAAATFAADTDSTVLVVGHNPGIASLVCTWADAAFAIPPCTVGNFRLAINSWTELPDDEFPQPELATLISDAERKVSAGNSCDIS